MYKRTISALLILVLVVPMAGCSAFSNPPTFKGQIVKFDAALATYQNGTSFYYAGKYAEAKDAFASAATSFKDSETAYKDIANQKEVTSLEKKISENMAGIALQYAYTAAYMRDASNAALQKDMSKAYLLQASAEEYDVVARQGYAANKAAMEAYWNSQPG